METFSKLKFSENEKNDTTNNNDFLITAVLFSSYSKWISGSCPNGQLSVQIGQHSVQTGRKAVQNNFKNFNAEM